MASPVRLGPCESSSHSRDDEFGIARDFSVGESDHCVTGEVKIGVAHPIRLERIPGTVKLESIELHNDLLLFPEEIDLESSGSGIHQRFRDPCSTTEVQEFQFQPRSGSLQFGIGRGDQHLEIAQSSPSRASVHHRGQRLPVEKSHTSGRIEISLELSPAQNGGQIQQRSRDTRGRNPIDSGDLMRRQVSGSVDRETKIRISAEVPRPRSPGSVEGAQHRRSRIFRTEPQECRRARPTQDGTGTAVEHGRHPAAPLSVDRTTDRVHPGIHDHQPTRFDSRRHGCPTQTRFDELAPGAKAMLFR